MAYTKAVITDPYYDQPKWMPNEVRRKPYLCLSSEASSQDVELFLTHLLGYMNISVDHSMEHSLQELFEQEHVAISGGVAFFEDEQTYILPSCCCGLEDYPEIVATIGNKQSPWLGHDPSPELTYTNHQVYVWPDEPTGSESQSNCIAFSYEELQESLATTSQEIIGFIEGPLDRWIRQENAALAETMKEKMKQWILK
ncbi:hypothetical protein PA598K_03954 [Paenibacillus sp. 598K]|uniref:hypothetical protein n=1 Tax=Paenibacillus sp. 598K TaxID=1117987 RepID=UPI000FFA3CFE|nr:hypothetical protein [Paenibacillus sp. 598K]GBF75537.1 hypothetical protein PA598K_03954 [Paenibacillus sp. 598K]